MSLLTFMKMSKTKKYFEKLSRCAKPHQKKKAAKKQPSIFP
ncbi:hypothetical protein SAMN04488027_104235 [Psychroflexus sediminis]|uniref:Uncharacterized protein n=1 Tax=Psychroflexus sediminis TaxID=470826 RepID=A0A1G7VXF5_9FLAO|nr:hypothetical protein SAMN04488027_104235 [Psychroflexus sediminis]